MPLLTLPDGRKLDYEISGDSNGFPLVWQHGTPGSVKATPPAFVRVCEKNGVKVISMSRAGYGESSRHKGRAIIDNVQDVKALCGELGIKECVAGGWSGGGPHVLALGARVPAVKAVLCVAGVAPADAPDLDFLAGQGQDNVDEWNATLAGEATLTKFLEAQRPGLISSAPEDVIKEMSSILPQADKDAMLKDSEFGASIVSGFQEALKHGVDGWMDDDFELLKPWGFDLSEIKVPVFLWQGDEDLMVPFAHGKWLASHLPKEGLVTHLEKGEGHLSIFLGREEEMLRELMAVVGR